MLIREHAEASPTTCVICNGTNEPVLDTATDVPGYGRINMCIGTTDNPGCLLQALRESYAADPALRGELETQIQSYAREVGILRDRATLAEELIAVIRASGALVDPPAPEAPPEPEVAADEALTMELTPDQLADELTRDELLDRAKELKIRGRNSMNKDELAAAIAEEEQEG